MSLYNWGDLNKNQQEAVKMFAGGNTAPEGRVYLDYELDAYMSKYNDYQKKQAETERIKADTALTEENTKQTEDKTQKADIYAQSESTAGSAPKGKNMLSAGTGFAKIRRKVLGSLGSLGSSDERLGG